MSTSRTTWARAGGVWYSVYGFGNPLISIDRLVKANQICHVIGTKNQRVASASDSDLLPSSDATTLATLEAYSVTRSTRAPLRSILSANRPQGRAFWKDSNITVIVYDKQDHSLIPSRFHTRHRKYGSHPLRRRRHRHRPRFQ